AEQAAREALDLVHFPLDREGPWDLDASCHDSARRAEIDADCPTLLVVLADVVAGRPGTDPERTANRKEARRLLGLAIARRPRWRALALRLAQVEEQLGHTAAAREEQARAERLPPSNALDYFLVGTHHAALGDFAAAAQAFRSAVSLESNHFWAQCYLGTCA